MTRPIDEIMAELRAKVRGDSETPTTSSPISPSPSPPPTPTIVGFVPFLSRKMERVRNHTRTEFVRLAHHLAGAEWKTASLLPAGERSAEQSLELVLFGDWFGIEIGRWAIDADVPYEVVLPYGDAPVAATHGPATDHHSSTDMVLGEAKSIFTLSTDNIPEAWPAARRYVFDHADHAVVLANGARRWLAQLQHASALTDVWLVHSDARPTERITT